MNIAQLNYWGVSVGSQESSKRMVGQAKIVRQVVSYVNC